MFSVHVKLFKYVVTPKLVKRLETCIVEILKPRTPHRFSYYCAVDSTGILAVPVQLPLNIYFCIVVMHAYILYQRRVGLPV